MSRIWRFITDNILFVLTLFLLMFIPLYPKLPLLDVVNTWVYVRAEDFVVVVALLIWTILLFRRKITLRTPLTMPIIIFWIIGGVATIHGALLIFPYAANIFPNIAFLSFLRRIEYLSLFFISYSAMRDKRFLSWVIATIVITLFLVIGYGFGQKYFDFPAFLTMNEEFAKGIAIRLSSLSRVPSTFGGHYDLAAYLVLIIPIITSLIFGFKNWLLKVVLLGATFLGFILLFMTVSRISFFVLLVSLVLVFLLHKKKLVLLFLPMVFLVLLFFLSFNPALRDRFGNTIKKIDVLVDATSGEAIGHVKEIPSENFKDKIIREKVVRNREELNGILKSRREDLLTASPSAVISWTLLPKKSLVIIPTDTPTGENLPQGTGYINLSLSPVIKRMGEFFYEVSDSPDVFIVHGNFLIKRASAYDLSFTTRFQGEWPQALQAFMRNIFWGSGYGSVSLAVDNNYLRLLGEVGLLGLFSFLAIFITMAIYIKKVLPETDSPVVRSFVFGFIAGVVGLALNAILIDVFEASKVAFTLWLLTGITLGALSLYQKNKIDLLREFKKVILSPFAIIVYLLLMIVIIFSPMIGNFFVGDDFTWFRWAADSGDKISVIFRYLTQSDGFFYRPGTKIYFWLMYQTFWLNQTVYHLFSILLHLAVTVLVFLLARKILRDFKSAVLASSLFVILSGYSEAVFWISATGHLFNAMFILLALFFFILWEEKKKQIFWLISVLSIFLGLLFHELGVVTPLLLILYKFIREDMFNTAIFRRIHYQLLFLPLLPYLAMRYLAQSHWFSGDYNYNLLKLPFNIVGNAFSYFFLVLFGPASLSVAQALRNFSKEHLVISLIVVSIISLIAVWLFKKILKVPDKDDKRIVIFGVLFFIISLLPFLALGNITSRYSYLASFGIVILLVFFIKKLYGYLQNQGRDIALASIVLIVALFYLLQIIWVQQIHGDWKEAGKKTQQFFISMDELYADYWAKEPMKFHFVNVPTRVGEAWIFPVGLPDALWLIFRNPQIQVYKWQELDQAMAAMTDPINEKIFEFKENGRVIERRKIFNSQ